MTGRVKHPRSIEERAEILNKSAILRRGGEELADKIIKTVVVNVRLDLRDLVKIVRYIEEELGETVRTKSGAITVITRMYADYISETYSQIQCESFNEAMDFAIQNPVLASLVGHDKRGSVSRKIEMMKENRTLAGRGKLQATPEFTWDQLQDIYEKKLEEAKNGETETEKFNRLEAEKREVEVESPEDTMKRLKKNVSKK